MALNKTNLKNSLQSIFTTPGSTIVANANAWASAYASYAATGVSCQSVTGVLTGREAALATALAAAFGAGTNPATTAASLDTAFVAFWAGVAFVGLTAGLAVAAPGTLTAALPAMWANNVATSASASAAAQAHADIFDTFTKTVIVTHVAPSVCAAPLS